MRLPPNLAIGTTGYLTGVLIVIVASFTLLPLKLKILMGSMLVGYDD